MTERRLPNENEVWTTRKSCNHTNGRRSRRFWTIRRGLVRLKKEVNPSGVRQPSLGVHGGPRARAGGCDRLLVRPVGDVSGGEHARDIGGRPPAFEGDVSVHQFDLIAEHPRVRDVTYGGHKGAVDCDARGAPVALDPDALEEIAAFEGVHRCVPTDRDARVPYDGPNERRGRTERVAAVEDNGSTL